MWEVTTGEMMIIASLEELTKLDGVTGTISVTDVSPTLTQVWFTDDDGNLTLLLQEIRNLGEG